MKVLSIRQPWASLTVLADSAIEEFVFALSAILECGRMSENSRVLYMAEIARRALVITGQIEGGPPLYTPQPPISTLTADIYR